MHVTPAPLNRWQNQHVCTVLSNSHRQRVAAVARRRPVGVCSTDRTDRRVRAARQRLVGRVHRVGAVGGVPRGVRVPNESISNNVTKICELGRYRMHISTRSPIHAGITKIDFAAGVATSIISSVLRVIDRAIHMLTALM